MVQQPHSKIFDTYEHSQEMPASTRNKKAPQAIDLTVFRRNSIMLETNPQTALETQPKTNTIGILCDQVEFLAKIKAAKQSTTNRAIGINPIIIAREGDDWASFDPRISVVWFGPSFISSNLHLVLQSENPE